MIDVKAHILLSKSERQVHLDLTESCCERGGNSTNHKGVLAQYLTTTIPSGRILLCHACNNDKCSNPKHLYWGTDKENIMEDNPLWRSAWDRSVEKYGYDEACKRNSRGKEGNTYGSGNKGKPKSEEHRRKIADAIRAKHNKDK